jgi:hypothetical protein
MCSQVKEIHDMGAQVCVVIGGGNIFRGLQGAKRGVDRTTGDWVLALDHDAQRLSRVRESLDRLHLSATLRVGDAAAPDGWWDGQAFDAILLDAPCSASGIVRRHPDIRWLRRASDIAALAGAARDAGALVAVDNTLATPLRQRPLELGADLSVASATKQLSGHGDLLLGYVAAAATELLAGVRAWRTPSSRAMASALGPVRFHTARSNSGRARWRASGVPMAPSPRKATRGIARRVKGHSAVDQPVEVTTPIVEIERCHVNGSTCSSTASWPCTPCARSGRPWGPCRGCLAPK